jgi:hypothetical protein
MFSIYSVFLYKRGKYNGNKFLMSKTETQDNAVDLRGTEDATSDVLVDDFKDLEIEMMAGSRAKTLWWMKELED